MNEPKFTRFDTADLAVFNCCMVEFIGKDFPSWADIAAFIVTQRHFNLLIIGLIKIVAFKSFQINSLTFYKHIYYGKLNNVYYNKTLLTFTL